MEATHFWLSLAIFYFIGFDLVANDESDELLRLAKVNHQPQPISERVFWQISNQLEDIEDIHNVLSKICIERVPGTINHEFVQQFIENRMQSLGWSVEKDEFFDLTPSHGNMRFVNIIARLNPNARRYLTVACHYDSKLMPNFVGATDSAVPCAIMLNLAQVLRPYLEQRRDSDLSLQFIFFDGEEAFVEWSSTDSIYGARHLAKKWQQSGELKKIDVLMLLDLLGGPNPEFYSYFPETNNLFNHLVDVETRLGAAGGLVRYAHSSANPKKRNQGYFQPYSRRMNIEDDHIPFLRRKVRVLHLIPVPFPDVWHTSGDNLRNVNFDATTNLNKIIGIFIMEYLHIDFLQ